MLDKALVTCRGLLAGLLIAGLLAPALALAEGRTYKPRKAGDAQPKYELCRLKKVERSQEEGTRCIYKRQSRGNDVVISNESPNVDCQAQFQCKREG